MTEHLRVLDLGAGTARVAETLFPDAYVTTLDIDPETHPDVEADVRFWRPELEGGFDVVVASHVLEHLPRLQVGAALTMWACYIKPGGRLQLHVPDLGWVAKELVRHQGVVEAGLLLHIYGDQGNEWGFHRCGFTALLLRALLRKAGLWVERLDSLPYQIVTTSVDGEKSRFDAKQLVVKAIKMEVPD